ncbi:MAG: hypothetical protein Q9195_006028 [Heterodermia aff. obscurata]
MLFQTSFLTASLLALASAGPLHKDIAAALKRQLPASSGSAANSAAPAVQSTGVIPTGVGSTAVPTVPTTPAAQTPGGNSSVGSVSTKGSVTGSVAVSSINGQDGKGAGTDVYKFYQGDGSTGAGWPASTDWVSFENMFEANKVAMKSSCSIYSVANNSDTEISAIHDSIEAVAKASKVDHRFILAVMMQESSGCVRVKTTNWGVRNPGLMQSHDGTGTCNDDKTHQVSTPCPQSTIAQMISDGAGGTAAGDGLAQALNQAKVGDVSAFYKAARIYDSGSVDASGDLGKGIATHCYSSDIANRLTGWVTAKTACTLDPATA